MSEDKIPLKTESVSEGMTMDRASQALLFGRTTSKKIPVGILVKQWGSGKVPLIEAWGTDATSMSDLPAVDKGAPSSVQADRTEIRLCCRLEKVCGAHHAVH
jgi:hypothetical protein